MVPRFFFVFAWIVFLSYISVEYLFRSGMENRKPERDTIGMIALVGAFGLPIILWCASKASTKKAKMVTGADLEKYSREWQKARVEKEDDLKQIEKRCADAKFEMLEKINSCVLSDLSLLERFLLKIGTAGTGRYSRIGKIRQPTCDADLLFKEASSLNDSFFTFLEDRLSLGEEVCRGPR